DGALLEGLSTTACAIWVAALLVRGWIRDRMSARQLSELAEELAAISDRRQLTEDLLEAVKEMHEETGRLRRDVGGLLGPEQAEGEPPARSTSERLVSPDLLLRVRAMPVLGGSRLAYELSSPSGRLDFQSIEAESRRLATDDLKEEHMRLFRDLERLLVRLDSDGGPLSNGEVAEELRFRGRDLYSRILPAEIRAPFREQRGLIGSLLVVTDEPWIPWELLHPDDTAEDDFFCMLFPMARWLSGRHGPARRIAVDRALGIEAAEVEAYRPLPHARRELQRLRGWIEERPGLSGDFLTRASHPEVVDQLTRGGYRLIHFAGHAEQDLEEPDRSRLILVDRDFRAEELVGEIREPIARDRPLVILNACRAARQGRAMTGIGGWPERWVRRCRCGALMSPQWAVRDAGAERFTASLYDLLGSGATLGRAVLEARETLRAENPDDPTYLAYSLYGHPNASIELGTG
ncbi:MAG: CHAT domain-containing protein, partial [Holophagales bacterium]|nr:CHAT domain-containing protein [Holophagales bacterium]